MTDFTGISPAQLGEALEAGKNVTDAQTLPALDMGREILAKAVNLHIGERERRLQQNITGFMQDVASGHALTGDEIKGFVDYFEVRDPALRALKAAVIKSPESHEAFVQAARKGTTLNDAQQTSYDTILYLYHSAKPGGDLTALHTALQRLDDPIVMERLLMHGAHQDKDDQLLKTLLAWGKNAGNARFVMTDNEGRQTTVDTQKMLESGMPSTDPLLNIPPRAPERVRAIMDAASAIRVQREARGSAIIRN